MTIKTIIDEDLCAECAHCCLLRPFGRCPSNAQAICVRGWPYTNMFWNVISRCPSYEKRTPNKHPQPA